MSHTRLIGHSIVALCDADSDFRAAYVRLSVVTWQGCGQRAATTLWAVVVLIVGTIVQVVSAPAALAADQVPLNYVAMGSSYAAGPDTSVTRTPCLRSSDNYPHRVAEARGMRLTDVSCTGATTANLVSRPQTAWTNTTQVSAVGPRTDLVTVTAGGNDLGYMGILTDMSCQTTLIRTGRMPQFRACRSNRTLATPSAASYTAVERSLVSVVLEIRVRAPRAKVVLVDYPPAVSGADRGCAGLPLTPDQISEARQIFDGLAAATERAAHTTGAILVRASKAGAAHTVCSPQPWLSGFTPPWPYHPTELGKQAVANLVLNAIR